MTNNNFELGDIIKDKPSKHLKDMIEVLISEVCENHKDCSLNNEDCKLKGVIDGLKNIYNEDLI